MLLLLLLRDVIKVMLRNAMEREVDESLAIVASGPLSLEFSVEPRFGGVAMTFWRGCGQVLLHVLRCCVLFLFLSWGICDLGGLMPEG